MNAVEELQNVLFSRKYGLGDLQECVDWAMARLSANEDDGDEDVVLLAGSTDERETKDLAHKIVERYLQPDAREESLWTGRFLVRLCERYREGTMGIPALEPIIGAMYENLGKPDWLAVLRRNCGYAADGDRFAKPFEEELEYIAGLWRQSASTAEFSKKYDRKVSDTRCIK